MKWIKASERLPEKDGEYFVKIFSGYTKTTFNSTCDFEDGEFQNRNRHTIVEWLDESEEQAGEKDKEIERLKKALFKIEEVTLDCHTQVEVAKIQMIVQEALKTNNP